MFFHYFGEYLLLLKSVFKKPEKWSIYKKEIILEMQAIGVGSLSLIVIISTFIGAVMTMQIAFQLVSDLIPTSVIGQINRDSNILELGRSEEHTSELQSRFDLVCRLLLEKQMDTHSDF